MLMADRKMSEIMGELAEQLLKNPSELQSSVTMELSLMLANIAWDETTDISRPREAYLPALNQISRSKPSAWNALISRDIDVLIDRLVQYKKKHFKHDMRRILVCGLENDRIHVEWIKPAEPGVDSRFEMNVYGMVRFGDHQKAIDFVKNQLRVSQEQAEQYVLYTASQLSQSPKPVKNQGSLKRPKDAKQALARARAKRLPSTSQPAMVAVRPDPAMQQMRQILDAESVDPVFGIYVMTQHLLFELATKLGRTPAMKKFNQIAEKSEKEYMPEGPPISPVTTSYYTSWLFNDLKYDGVNTIATTALSRLKTQRELAEFDKPLRNYANSRMGIFEHIGKSGRFVKLRELCTDSIFKCIVPSGYAGTKGELWFARTAPPLVPDPKAYHVLMTTPYILVRTSKQDWIDFLNRSLAKYGKTGDTATDLHEFLKYGPDKHYWLEFIMEGYAGHQKEAVFLTGIPDIKSTLPHAGSGHNK